jgi:spermidine synthase
VSRPEQTPFSGEGTGPLRVAGRSRGRHRRAGAPPGPAAFAPEDTGDAAPAEALPLPAGAARWIVLAAVLVCSACGLVYELALVALGGQLGPDPVTETSVVLSVMVFAMGVGALAAKPFGDRPAEAFAIVETALAAVGGTSVAVVYAGAHTFGLYRLTMLAVCVATGILVGAEIPLLMTLVQRIRRQDAGHAVADLFAADYVGALGGGLLFPFLLLPALGQTGTVALVGAVNALVGTCVVLWLFRADLDRRARARICVLVVSALVLIGGVAAIGPQPPAATREDHGAKCSSACTTGA